MFKKLEDSLLELLMKRKRLYYQEVAVAFDIALSTASSYARILATKYPNNITYYQGQLILEKPLAEGDLSPEERIRVKEKALARAIEDRNKKDEAIKKVKANHIAHIEGALAKGDTEALKREIERLKKTLSEKEA